MVFERLVQGRVGRHAGAEPIQFVLAGKVSVNQQKARFDKVGSPGQLLDGNAAIAENALLTIDVANGTLADSGIAEAGVERDQTDLARSDVMSTASSPSEPSTTGSSIV